MKKKLIISVIIILIVIVVYILLKGIKTKKSNEINITTSFYPIYVATLNITEGVEGVLIKNLTNNLTGCLHDYTLTTTELATLSDTDLFIINGAGMEAFMDKIIANYPKLNIIDSSKNINLIKEDDGEEYNGHIFVSISNYIKQVENITEEIINFDEKNKEKYTLNSKQYIEKLENILQNMKEVVSKAKYKNIVTFHDSFEYFADEFGLNVVGTIESEHGKSPSAGEITALVKTIIKENVKSIFVEPEYNINIAQTVAKEADVKLYILKAITTGDGSKDSYINQMKENINTLKEALY